MISAHDPLRVALVAGTLAKGGAEKQLVLTVEALLTAGANVRVYAATRGEFHEAGLRKLDCEPIWFGQRSSPLMRLVKLTRLLRGFRPHVIQSAHFYTNLYVALAGRMLGTTAFGTLRSSVVHEVEENGYWGPWLLKLPTAIIANSYKAQDNATIYGVERERVEVVPNVIDLQRFDQQAAATTDDEVRGPAATAISICRMVSAKRLERFLEALHQANHHTRIDGLLVGDGPQRAQLEARARALGLLPERVRFLGWQDDIPALLRSVDMLVTCSDHEGFPNVLLEAMAAGIPAIGTPAGDVRRVIVDDVTGFVVPFEGVAKIAERLVQLADDAALRKRMGAAARQWVEQEYSLASIAPRLLWIYRNALAARRRAKIEPRLSAH